MSTTEIPTARVTQRFITTPERVFDAWLNPADIECFLFGPKVRDEEIVRLQVDPRAGGEFSFVVRRDGKELDHIGRYLVIERPGHLAFTWAVAPERIDASKVDIVIDALEKGCELRLAHELAPGWEDWVGQIEGSWSMMLGRLGEALKEQ